MIVIEQNVARISVPRKYTRELYDMRIHIEMLREKLIAAGADVCRVSTETAATDRRALTHEEAGPGASPIAAS